MVDSSIKEKMLCELITSFASNCEPGSCASHCYQFDCPNVYKDDIGYADLNVFQPKNISVLDLATGENFPIPHQYLKFNTMKSVGQEDADIIINKKCDLLCNKSIIDCELIKSKPVRLNRCGWSIGFGIQLEQEAIDFLKNSQQPGDKKMFILSIKDDEEEVAVWIYWNVNTSMWVICVLNPFNDPNPVCYSISEDELEADKWQYIIIKWDPCLSFEDSTSGAGWILSVFGDTVEPDENPEPVLFPEISGNLCIGWLPELENDPTWYPLWGCFDQLYIYDYVGLFAIHIIGEEGEIAYVIVQEIILGQSCSYEPQIDDDEVVEIKKLAVPICFNICGDLCNNIVPKCEDIRVLIKEGDDVVQEILNINSILQWPGCLNLTKLNSGCRPQYHTNLCLNFMKQFCCPLTLTNGQKLVVEFSHVHTVIDDIKFSGSSIFSVGPGMVTGCKIKKIDI